MFGKRRKWLLVKTEIIDGITNKVGGKGRLYFYLYESGDGHRKEEHKFVSIECNDNMNSIPDYWDKIYPWLQGTNFPDIPTYWQAQTEKLKDDVKEMYKRMLSY